MFVLKKASKGGAAAWKEARRIARVYLLRVRGHSEDKRDPFRRFAGRR